MFTEHKQLCCLPLIFVCSLLWSTSPLAALVALGDQDFNDGDSPNLSTYNAVQVGEASPFDGFKGDDREFQNTVIGGEQDFNDGNRPDLSTYNSRQTGEGGPFGGFIGDDRPSGSNFNASWALNYAPVGMQNAQVDLGLYDYDCLSANCNVVGLFSVDGVNFTSALNSAIETTGAQQQIRYDVFSCSSSDLI